ncbi:MAG: four helix bundle protein [Desulfobacterales bacterium]|nr:four helix bundle protein [Desulfobacterales bacterium]
MDSEELKQRAKRFAHRCVKLAVALPKTPLGNHLRGQLIRCSTSVAANYRATLLAQTKAAFISKISIVIEEADESEFWLEFIMDEKLMKKEKVLPLHKEAHELASIFIVSRRTAQKKSSINNQQSTILNQQSTINNQQSTIQKGRIIIDA